MKTVTHKSYKSIKDAAEKLGSDILDSGRAFYFRIFVDRKCKELHVFYKP